MDSYEQLLTDLREPTRSLRKAIPDAWSGFVAMHAGAMAEGTVPTRLKEAIALAIGVVKRCDGCIGYHSKAAVRAGATPEEVAEILAIALLMDGGTANVYAPKAWAAYQEFAAKAQAPPPEQEVAS